MEKIPKAPAAYTSFLTPFLQYAVNDNRKSMMDKNVDAR